MDNENILDNGIQFSGFTTNSLKSPIIKVIGVGGGGGNAVNHMYNEGIHDVTYTVCNTDRKALEDSPVPNKLQLGEDGLGAGNCPQKGREAAEKSIEDIHNMLDDGTRMVFITAGMGGGTGTGAAPVIAKCAKEMGILTVGIVTIPFLFEGAPKIDQALDGVDEIYKHVDAMLVINNERLREIYPELSFLNAFARANDTLTVAARGIAEIITMRGYINLDFQDVTTVLKNGGVALMSTGYGEGENRLSKAINAAITSPLLNNNDIFNSKKILLNINFNKEGGSELSMEEMGEVHEFMRKFRPDVNTKWGVAFDESLGDKIKVTILASGFGVTNVPGMEKRIEEENELSDEVIEQNNIRRVIYYPNDNSAKERAKRNIYHFTEADLDNDDIISMLETTPTFRRTKEELKGIKDKQSNTTPIEHTPSETVADDHITFA